MPYLTDKKALNPYSEDNYTKGNYIVIADVLNVREGPDKTYAVVQYSDLTVNAKQQMKSIVNYPANGYVKEMKFTALETRVLDGESWARTPNGWVCIYNKDGVYCKKI